MLRLEELRKKEGLSQTDFANKFGMNQQRISAYEKGIREPDLETLKKFADFFGVSVDYLLGKDEPKYNEELVKFGLKLKKEYEPPTAEQKKQIEDFIEFVLKDNKKED